MIIGMERSEYEGPKVTLYVRRGSKTVAAVPLRAGNGHMVFEDVTLELQAGDRLDLAMTYDIKPTRGEG